MPLDDVLPFSGTIVLPWPVSGITSSLSRKDSSSGQGPFRIGTFLYGFVSLTGGVPSPLIAVKRTASGGAWSELDSGNRPTQARGYVIVADTSAGFVHFVYRDNTTGTLTYARFNTNTDTWGSEVDSTITVSEGLYTLSLRSDGTVVCLYRTGTTFQYRVITSQAWGSATTIAASVTPITSIAGSTNIIHYLYADSTTIYYNTLSAANVIGTAATVALLSNFVGGISNMVINSDQIFIQGHKVVSTDQIAQVLIGTPVSSPVWTQYDIHGTLARPGNSWLDTHPFIAEYDDESVYCFFTVNYKPAIEDDSVVRLYGAYYNGSSFEEPQLFWDSREVTTPDLPVFAGYEFEDQSASVLFDDNVVHILVQATPVDADSQTSVVYLEINLDPLSIVCNNPPSGTVGTPYTHEFIAGGGNPPYVITIAAGALPPGLSMNTDGDVTGTPTLQGVYYFTVMVEDENGTLATVNCSIFINFIEEPPEPHPCPTPDIGTLPSFEGTAISIADELYLRNSLFGDFGLVPPELKLKRQIDRFVKSGTNPTFTLSETPNDDYPVAVYFDNVLQFPTEDYTISGLTYTMVGTFSLANVRAEYQVPANA